VWPVTFLMISLHHRPVLVLKMQRCTSCATHQARVVIDNVQDPDAPTAGELIVDEVH
jgi:hypothetical protein